MSTTAALVALGRKLAGTCFALLVNGTDFSSDLHLGAWLQRRIYTSDEMVSSRAGASMSPAYN